MLDLGGNQVSNIADGAAPKDAVNKSQLDNIDNSNWNENGADLSVANGGTGASDAATARTNLGVAIGSDVQAFDADILTASNTKIVTNKTIDADLNSLSNVDDSNWGGTDLAVANGGTGASDAATARTNLGVAIGSDVQAFDTDILTASNTKTVTNKTIDADLNSLSNVDNSNWGGDDLAVANGGTGASDAATARTNLGVAIGSDVQGYDADTTKNDVANTFTATQTWAKGADVASATSVTLGSDGNFFDITVTTAITAFASLGVGTVVKLQFDRALTLTHHATDLVLPGGANITTAAGDVLEMVEYAAGDWLVTNYQTAATAPGGSSGLAWQYIGTVSGSSQASITVDETYLTGYTDYRIEVQDLQTTSASQAGQFRVSTDKGSTWKTLRGNFIRAESGGTNVSSTQTNNTQYCTFTAPLYNPVSRAATARIELVQGDGSRNAHFYYRSSSHYDGGGSDNRGGYGECNTSNASVVDLMQFRTAAGSISGEFAIYGKNRI